MKWDEMTARERDALIAEKVMGWKKQQEQAQGIFWIVDAERRIVDWRWNPSTDIADAWQVVEMLRNLTIVTIQDLYNGKFSCDFNFRDGSGYVESQADTAPEAICKASLKAMGVDIE